MLDFQKLIRSVRVILRPMMSDDFEKLSVLTTDPKMWYYFPTDLSDTAELKNWIQTAVLDHKEHRALPFIIVDQNNDKIIGCTRISKR